MGNTVRTAVIALTLLLAACGNPDAPQDVRDIQAIDQQCIVYDKTLRSLALLRASDKLSEGQIETIDFWRPQLNAYCDEGAEAPDNISAALDLLERGILELSKMEE